LPASSSLIQIKPTRRLAAERSITLVFRAFMRDRLERSVRQRLLQRLRLIPRRAHSNVPFCFCCEVTGMAFGCIGLDHRVRCGRQEPVDEVRAGDRLRLRATVSAEFGPDAGEGEQRTVVICARTRRRPSFWSPRLARARIRQSCSPAHRFSGFSQPASAARGSRSGFYPVAMSMIDLASWLGSRGRLGVISGDPLGLSKPLVRRSPRRPRLWRQPLKR
jgi:hypothetical protein